LSSSPDIINKLAHDAFTRKRQPLSSENLWNEVKTFVKNDQGVLIIDVLEKPYSQKNMKEDKRKELENEAWKIEEYHRGLKQCCGVERFQFGRTESINRAYTINFESIFKVGA
jgi:hypothetical protein